MARLMARTVLGSPPKRRVSAALRLAAALWALGSCAQSPREQAAWEHHALVMVKSQNVAESNAIGSPDVAWVDGIFYMAYAQGNETTGTGDRINKGSIGLASSADGIAWTKLGTILEPAALGAWDDWFLDTPSLVIADGLWYLYYFGDGDNVQTGGGIGLATSSDGETWTRFGSQPVLARGSSEDTDWDGIWVESPSVEYDEASGVFHMWYTGVDKSWMHVRTGHASSPDGLTWAKDPANPVLGELYADFHDTAAWNGAGAGVAAAYLYDGACYLYYASQSVADALAGRRLPSIGLAGSLDMTSFYRQGSMALFTPDSIGNQPDGPYNPSALFQDGRWYVWYESGLGFGLFVSSP